MKTNPQLDLFSPNLNKQVIQDHRKENSREAYAKKKPKAGADQDKILEAMQRLNRPVTTKEIAPEAGLEYIATVRRMSELCELGCIIPAGEKGRMSLYTFVKFREIK